MKIVDDVPWGVYVVKIADGPNKGKYLSDDDHNYLCVAAQKNDAKKVAALLDAARHYGFPNVVLEFRAGARIINDEEFENQKGRLAMGLTPDPWDLGSALDDYNDGRI